MKIFDKFEGSNDTENVEEQELVEIELQNIVDNDKIVDDSEQTKELEHKVLLTHQKKFRRINSKLEVINE